MATGIPQYTIWIRNCAAEFLYARFDPTQNRPTGYVPTNYSAYVPYLTGPNASKLSRGFYLVGQVVNYEKLEFKTKYNNVGGWTLLMQDGTEEAIQLRNLCYGLSSQGIDNATYHGQGGYGGIKVVRDGVTIFSGPVRGFEATGDFFSEHGPMITFYGADDNDFLNRRLAMTPAPGNELVYKQASFGSSPYGGFYYSGRAVTIDDTIPGNLGLSGTFIPPRFQGWGYFQYPSLSALRRVSTVLREIVRNNIGVYAPFPLTYPVNYIFNGYTPLMTYPNYATWSDRTGFNVGGAARRIPFLFMGTPSAPSNAWVNNADSNGIDNGTEEQSGPYYRVRSRYDNLLEKCQEIATFVTQPINFFNLPDYRGFQFSLTQKTMYVQETISATEEKNVAIEGLKFDYRPPRQTENTIIFSQELENMGSYKYTFKQPTATYTVVAGQGQGQLRWFFTKPLQETRFGIAEKFIDRRDIQYGNPENDTTFSSYPVYNLDRVAPSPPYSPTRSASQQDNYNDMYQELNIALDTSLRETGTIFDLDLQLIDSDINRYFVDYFVGDYCTVILAGQDIVGQITDVEVSITRNEGEVVRATVGTQPIGDIPLIFNAIDQGKRDTSRLEISQ